MGFCLVSTKASEKCSGKNSQLSDRIFTALFKQGLHIQNICSSYIPTMVALTFSRNWR